MRFKLANAMIFYTENPKNAIKNSEDQLINKFSKCIACKINIKKYITFLYTNINYHKEKSRTTSFITASKIINSSGINLTKEVKGLYTENHKIMIK